MDEATRRFVRVRAGQRCEYCGRHRDDSPLAALHVEHIVPRKHAGSDEVINLALACIDCNLGKSSNLTGIDPVAREITPLYNPRTQIWEDHFTRHGPLIIGLTAVGRTTVYVLNMNSEDQVERRRQSGS